VNDWTAEGLFRQSRPIQQFGRGPRRGSTRIRSLELRLDLFNHSPIGFEWGYGGSGPAQLAPASAEPIALTRLLDAQASRCAPFRVFFLLIFSNTLGASHPQVTVTALGGASAGRRFFAGGAGNVIPANISDLPGLIATGRLATDIVLLQLSGPDAARCYNTGLGIEHLDAAIARARFVVAQLSPELPWTEGDTMVEAEAIDLLVPAKRHRGRSTASTPRRSPPGGFPIRHRR
jgi:hypothetical protein